MATMADTKGRRTRRSFTDDYKTRDVLKEAAAFFAKDHL